MSLFEFPAAREPQRYQKMELVLYHPNKSRPTLIFSLRNSVDSPIFL